MADTSNRHHPWEDQWREAFDGAEAPVSPHVWKNIESELVIRETGKYRRGFLFYRAIAAALLLLIAGLSWYIVTQQKGDSNSLSDTGSAAPKVTEPNQSSENRQPPLARVDSNQNTLSGPGDVSRESITEQSASNSAEEAAPSQQPEKAVSDESPSLAYQDEEPLPSDALPSRSTSKKKYFKTGNTPPPAANAQNHTLAHQTESEITKKVVPYQPYSVADSQALIETTAPGNMVLTVDAQGIAAPSWALPASLANTEKLYRVPQPLVAHQKDKKESQKEFFAGLTLAPGYFDPKLQSSAVNPGNVLSVAGPSGAPGQGYDRENALYSNSVPTSSAGINDHPELSLTYGVDVGMKLSEHWLIESGIDYNRFSTNAETRWEVADVATGNRYPYLVANRYQLDETASSPAPTMTTSVNNAYEFISVPMQIGYQVALSRLHFILSSGIAANFFLGNNISAPASPLTNFRVSTEASSPFKALYYSGVLSGGINYNIVDNYSFSLTPSYTFALTELTKQESTLSSQPYSFGINVGFQYLF